MNLNKSFSEVKYESNEIADDIKSATGIEVAPDYAAFRSSVGGIQLEGDQPYLLLHPLNKAVALAEFHGFYDYEHILHQLKRSQEDPEDWTNKKLKEHQIMQIGSCEEQVNIYMGYGKNNLNLVYIYIVEEDILEAVGKLEGFINHFLIEYSEDLA